MILSFFFFSSRRRHTRLVSDWSSDVCSSDLSHVLKNALIPVVTVLGLQLGTLIGGAVITEYVFALPGVGRLVVDAVFARDYPLVQGVVLLIAVGFIVSNLCVDILYGFIDPRIRYR